MPPTQNSSSSNSKECPRDLVFGSTLCFLQFGDEQSLLWLKKNKIQLLRNCLKKKKRNCLSVHKNNNLSSKKQWYLNIQTIS